MYLKNFDQGTEIGHNSPVTNLTQNPPPPPKIGFSLLNPQLQLFFRIRS